MRNVSNVLAMVACCVLVAGAGRPVDSSSNRLSAADSPATVDQVTGDEAVQVVPAVPHGPAITAVLVGQDDGLLLVDVFVSGVVDVRGYQVSLAATTGGNRGRLEIQDIWVDTSRADYVFASEEAVNAVDLVGGRLVGAMFSGSVDAMRPAYAGTFAFKATPDAQGNFKVSVQMGSQTLLRNSASQPIALKTGAAVVIAVGEVPVGR